MCQLLRFFFTAPRPTEFYTLSLHDALPILGGVDLHDRSFDQLSELAPLLVVDGCAQVLDFDQPQTTSSGASSDSWRSEEHTSELQSQFHLVCRLLLEKKKEITHQTRYSQLI